MEKVIFSPELCQCSICDTILRSEYPGQFRQCECGESFVDQTPHYSRYGGAVKSVEHLIYLQLEEFLND
jgi:hypothetical protein